MEPFQSIGIREFRQNIHKYTATSQEPFTVTSHGRAIGYYIPANPTPNEADFQALRQATEKLQRVMRAIGVTEDEIVTEFDYLRKAACDEKNQ